MRNSRNSRLGLLLVSSTLSWGCGDAAGAGSGTAPETSGSTGEESEAASETGADGVSAEGTGDSQTSAETSTETGTATGDGDGDEPLRFVVLGDGGEGNEAQFSVANAMEIVCAERGCEFALYLGDNFYDSGVDSNDDQQFQTKFELPFQDLDFPFYVTLGNHDYGGFIGGVFANEWGKAAYEISYTDFSEKWTLPAKWYAFNQKHARFISIDSPRMMFEYEQEEQKAWVSGTAIDPGMEWNIAFAHHPYISNGAHGNAGNYEGIPWPDIVSGDDVKSFVEEELCFNVDIYFTGHDHTRQWLEPTCGVEFIVSGAAAKVTDFSHRDDNPVYWEDDSKPGFMWVELDGKTMTGAFYDLDANLDFERTFTKP
jgi:hypothetical protein